MARVDFGAKPLSYPQPVLIICAYDKDGKVNAMNAAWGGMSNRTEISICLTPSHKTCKNFMETGAFTVSMGDVDHVVACDYVGIVSGNDEPNKMEKAGFTVTKSELVNAPIINELAVCMECKVKSFDLETGRLVGEVVNVSCDESAMTDGCVDVSKVKPIAFDPFNNTYVELGDVIAKAFACGAELK